MSDVAKNNIQEFVNQIWEEWTAPARLKSLKEEELKSEVASSIYAKWWTIQPYCIADLIFDGIRKVSSVVIVDNIYCARFIRTVRVFCTAKEAIGWADQQAEIFLGRLDE